MSDNSKIAEILVSQLGAPKEPGFEWIAAATLLLLIGAYMAVEQGVVQLLRRILRTDRSKDDQHPDLPPD